MAKNAISSSAKKALIPVQPTNVSSKPQDGKCVQLSEQDAVAHSTRLAREFLSDEKKVVALLAMFKGLLDNTYSQDVIFLAALRAKDMLARCMSEEEAALLISEIITKVRRTPQPMDCMF